MRYDLGQDWLHVLCICMSTHISINRQEGAFGKKHLSMKKSFLKFMTISLLTAMSMAVNAGIIVYTDGDFKYSLETETKTAALSKYSGSATEVTIPESVTHDDVTYSVTRLGDKCFSYCSSLTSIDIPSSVTSLGDECFSYCSSLTSIDIPSSVTSLGYKCFSGCESLTSIDIPSSVTSLGIACFFECSSLTSIDIPSSVTSLGEGCFSGCESLTSITVDENNPVYDSRENCNAIIETGSNTMIAGCASTSIPSSVTSLGSYCFYYCRALTTITIPSSVTSLGYACFFECSSLTSIDIPSSVTSLRDYCFSGCSSLTSIDISSSVTSLGYMCFYGCSALTSVTIPSSVTSLGDYCLSGCSSLTSIDIPSSVTSLGEGCFYGSSALTSIDIPSSVTSLGNYCFSDCSSLTSIDIPSSVTSLGYACFSCCKSIKTMTCEIPTAIEGEFFSDTPIEQATLYVPESSLDSYKATSPWCYFGEILPISPDGIGEIATDGEAGIDAIYDIEGKRCNGTNRGLSIIRMSDGTTRKVLK